AAGVPLLAADLPAIGEIVRRWDVGRLVDPTAVGAIRRGIRELIDDPVARAAMAEPERRAATDELNWAHEFAGLAALYQRLVPRAS
ncbi:MAG TPA: glycosyltransferase, partial [Candidatus Limnocylindrales bacterium]|nr:glycosyltransferase [Candidatus Limnocylindrales bacterium]